MEVVCAPKILPIGIFLSYTSRFKITSPWDVSTPKLPAHFAGNRRAFSSCISKVASLWLCSWQSDWTRLQKRLRYEVNFLPTASGTVDQCTILTLSPQRHLFTLKCYRRERDAVKLTVKRVIKELRVTKFRDEYTKIIFRELCGWINPFEITCEKLILIENTFSSANLK